VPEVQREGLRGHGRGVADIYGHDKPAVTYGLYSSRASLAVKREAIEELVCLASF